MSQEERQSQANDKGKTDVEIETRSRSSSETCKDPFGDENASAAQPLETSSQAEDPKQEGERLSISKSAPRPSYDPLVFANYPPVWTSNPRPRPNPQANQSSPGTSRRSQSGFSAETLSAVMSSGSKDDKGKKFKEKDPSNRHQYLQGPDKSYSRAELNIFGRPIGGLGKHPGMGFRRQKGK